MHLRLSTFHATPCISSTLLADADHQHVVKETVKGSLKKLKAETIRKLKIHGKALFNKILKKATNLDTYIDFVPGLGPQDRLASAPSRSGLEGEGEQEFQDAEEAPSQPTWQKYVDILFEVNHQYPEELKCLSWGLILFSYMCVMGLLMIQSRDTRGCTC